MPKQQKKMLSPPFHHLEDVTLAGIIELAQKVRAYKDAWEFAHPVPADYVDEFGVITVGAWLDDRPLPNRLETNGPHWLEMQKLLEGLPKPALAELTALMWLGRQQEGTFREFLSQAIDKVDEPYHPLYVSLKPLWDYLPAGLARVRKMSE